MRTLKSFLLVAVLAAGCNLDVPDLDNPGIDQLEDNPTPSAVSAACTGLLIGSRGNIAQANGYVAQLGILGREAYNFDQADPRFVGELLAGDLNSGSPFGGNFWSLQYRNIRLGDIIVRAIDKVPDYSAEQRAAIAGFVHTIQAVDLLEVTVTRDTNGVVLDPPEDIHELAPIADVDAAYAHIAELLDNGADELDTAGTEAFPFDLSSGFAGFDTPETFRTFNRALRARVAAYTMDYDVVLTALGESFIDDPMTLADLEVGVYHTFSTSAGDTQNNLINPNIYVHPSITAHAEAGDLRYARKVADAETPGAAQGLTSDKVFTIYTDPSSPVPIIRREELILLRAEAEIMMNDLAAAETDINLVRAQSGGLAPITLAAGTAIDQLLHEREFSLLFEGGFKWIDARRFGKVDELLQSDPGMPFDHVNIRYPIPLAECNARPGEAACELGSR